MPKLSRRRAVEIVQQTIRAVGDGALTDDEAAALAESRDPTPRVEYLKDVPTGCHYVKTTSVGLHEGKMTVVVTVRATNPPLGETARYPNAVLSPRWLLPVSRAAEFAIPSAVRHS
jgi:hypothetical protein